MIELRQHGAVRRTASTDLAAEPAAQLKILAVRGVERGLQVLSLDAMALLELSDLRRELVPARRSRPPADSA